ncbi:calmodulin-like [Pectinophora gossypiella]|uniref:calmodulin-like n=1 Tax=Pectinophora gossypiella TaxID=13191 RepID=UPI00214E87B3|nr:calmodulin-like [Pectinophora gossypiella]
MPPKGKDKGKAKPPAGKKGVDLQAVAGKPPKPKKIPPPPACFNTEDLMKFREMFKLYDEDNIDKVKLNAIPVMLRALGFNPKGQEIQELFKKFLEDEFVDTVDYHEWLFMIEAKLNWGDDFEAVVTKAMGFLGHDDEEEPKGIIKLDILREELMNWGETLNDLEFVDWPKIATKDKTYVYETGDFNYVKFIENMNAKDTRFIAEPINYFKLDQRTLAAMAMQKALDEKAEIARREADRLLREEAKRQKMIADGLIVPDELKPHAAKTDEPVVEAHVEKEEDDTPEF